MKIVRKLGFVYASNKQDALKKARYRYDMHTIDKVEFVRNILYVKANESKAYLVYGHDRLRR